MERVAVLWCPGLSIEGPRSAEIRLFADLLEVVRERCPFVRPVRLGLATFPARSPSRFFGGEAAVLSIVRDDLSPLLERVESPLQAGIADGLFAALLAARADQIVSAGATREFLAPFSIATLRRPELASVCQRLGLTTLGRFAGLPAARVIERFGAEGAHCQQVARGEVGDLEGVADPSIVARLRSLTEPPPPPPQPTFFGGASMVDERAARVAIRLQGRLGPAGVQVARFLTGHDPAERATMVPFGSSGDLDSGGNHHDAPWPGHLPAPSPAIVVSNPSAVELVGVDGVQVEVSGRGLLSTAPVRCSLHRSQPSEEVIAWAGPWPLATRWWDRRRWRVRIQVLTASGAGLLLAAEQGQWWLLGRYD